MLDTFDNLAGGNLQRNSPSEAINHTSDPATRGMAPARRGPTFSKFFRWQTSDPRAATPASVELAGSFTDWRPVELQRDAVTNTWQITMHGIPGNRTHRYMLLVNGEPAQDRNCDGLAVPENPRERQYQLMTARGPRVLLLFSQTK